jgi:hypothetical protein
MNNLAILLMLAAGNGPAFHGLPPTPRLAQDDLLNLEQVRLALTYTPGTGRTGFQAARETGARLVFPSGYYTPSSQILVDCVIIEGRRLSPHVRTRPIIAYHPEKGVAVFTTSWEAVHFVGRRPDSFAFTGSRKLTDPKKACARPYIGIISSHQVKLGVVHGTAPQAEAQLTRIAKDRKFSDWVWVDGGSSFSMTRQAPSHLLVLP